MSRSPKTTLIVAVLVGAIALPAGLIGAYSWLQREFTDGDSIRRSARADAPRDVLWENPRLLDDLAQIPGEMYEPRLSWDGMTLFFVRGKAGTNADIFTARRTPAGWSTPEPLTAINTEHDELGPELSADGSTLYFYSDRPGGFGGYDIWMARRDPNATDAAAAWQAPINLGPAVNSEFNDYGPAVSRDGKTLYFASNRPQAQDQRQPDPHAWPATVREDWFKRTYDLYQAALSESGPAPATAIAALNTASNEGAPCISPSGDFLYFTSDRPGGFGGFDLYRARLLHGEIQAAQNLGPAINTPANELDPGLAQLGFALYFSSDRPVASAASNERQYRVYYSGSREVFADRPPIDWAALWRAYWPLLAWILLGVLTALLLWQLIKDIRDGKLSLLARCLLASLLLHCLLLMGLGYWRVKAALGEYMGGGGKVKVMLAATGMSGDLFAQVRGNLTDAAAPETVQADAQPVHAEMELNAAIQPLHVEAERSTGPEPVRMVEMNPTEATPAERTPLPQPAATPAVAAILTLTTPRAAEPMATNEPAAATPNVAESAPVRAPTLAATAPQARLARVDVTPALGGATAADHEIQPMALTGVADAPATARTSLPNVAAGAAPQPVAMQLNTPAVERTVAPGGGAAEPEATVTPVNSTAAQRAALPMRGGAAPQVLKVAPESATASGLPDGKPEVDVRNAAFDADARSIGATVPASNAASRGFESTIALALPKAAPSSQPSAASAPSSAQPAPVAADLRGGSHSTPLAAAAPSLQTIKVAPDSKASAPASVGGKPDGAVAIHDASPSHIPATPQPANSTASAGLLPLPLALPTPATSDKAAPAAAKAGARQEEHGLAGGVLRGRVLDAETKSPLADTTIRFDQAAGEAITAVTGADGTYELNIVAPPEFFAVTATHEGYLPEAKNVKSEALKGGAPRLDFTLRPANESVIAVEDEPEVHHLGNDLWEGKINSQFQRKTEGDLLVGEFSVSAAQAPPNSVRAAVAVMVKGIQCPHQVRINGTLLPGRWDHSPADGSFGELVLTFDPKLLHEGPNQISIQAVWCNGDLDDFEFVNVQIRLTRRE